MFSLESPHRGDSNEYTQYTIFNIKKKNTLNYSKSTPVKFFLGTQKRVRNSRGKRAISVRATGSYLLRVAQFLSSKESAESPNLLHMCI